MKKCVIFLSLFILYFSFLFSNGPTEAKKGMVVSADSIASQVGANILKKGGNAIDAAVATGFALAVTYPQAGNIGGGGFMVIRLADGKSFTIDFREKAPGGATETMYLDKLGNYIPDKSRIGHLACGVPGSVAGLLMVQRKFGNLSVEEVISPAIELAEKGFPLHPRLADLMKSELKEFCKFPSTKKIFTKNGQPFKEGEIFIQKDLATTFKRIVKFGEQDFYYGETAQMIVKEMKNGNGLITLEDLNNYKAIMRKPIKGNYRGYEIITMGTPSSGGIALMQLLNLIEPFPIKDWGWNSQKTVHVCVEAMKRVYADRSQYLGDGDFVKVPEQWLLSKKYADERRSEINLDSATDAAKISYGKRNPHTESMHTTHYSVIDSDGNAVSVTTTLNGVFGNYVIVDGAGFFLNNEMDDFSVKPGEPNMYGLIGSFANSIQPNKRMLSSMTPTIVVKDNKPVIILGSPGGSTIITTVFQVIMNVIDHGMNIQNAVDSYRFHNQWLPDVVKYEKNGFSKEVIQKLESMGHKLQEVKRAPNLCEGIFIDLKTGIIYGASDNRGYGAAIGF